MSESDSGVDTGSESCGSNCMSVESPHRSDEDKDCSDAAEKLQSSPLHRDQLLQVPFSELSPIECNYAYSERESEYLKVVQRLLPCDYGYSDYRESDYFKKERRLLHKRKLNMRWKHVNGIYPIVNNVIGERRLRQAANNNSLERVQNLLDAGVNPCAADERKRSALHFAACRGYANIARVLIERGADTNQRDVIGNTPLHLAACTSHIEMVTLLLKAGTDVNALDNSGRTPLHLAQSKLKILQMSKCYSSSELKAEVVQIVEMIQVYLQRSGKTVEVDMLNVFSNRLHHHQTREEVDLDVQDLLSSLSHLSLQKT